MQTARTTSGQTLRISYDARTNTVTFRELDWFADPVRSGADPVTGRSLRLPGPFARVGRKPPVRRPAQFS